MKHLIQSACAVACLAVILLFSSCKENVVRGKGEVTTKDRKVAGFNKVVIDMAVDATIVVGQGTGIRIKAQDNLHEHIKTTVKNNTLVIEYDKGILLKNEDIHVTIAMPAIVKLAIKGAADADIKGDVRANKFELEVKGASDVEIDELHVATLVVKLSGASELDIRSGIAGYAEYKVTGAGEIKAEKLVSNKVKAKVSGAGEMALHVKDSLNANIAGAGEINYTGHPHITSRIAGAGYLNDRN